MSGPAPVLVLAVGNPSRGDDALGPELAARLAAAAIPGVEVIEEFQLQVENALDLAGRELVVFVDAGLDTPAPFELREVGPGGELLHSTHSLSPESVLATYVTLNRASPPRALVLCVRGESFGLGEPLSPGAAANLDAAWERLRELCAFPRRTET